MAIPVVSYVRVSGKGQLKKDGFPRQREKMAKYAQYKGFEIQLEGDERGVTGDCNLEGRVLGGRTPTGLDDMVERRALREIVDYARQHDIHVLLVENADRFARENLTLSFLLLWLQKDNITVMSADGDINLTDSSPLAKLIRTIVGAVAEYDKDNTVLERCGNDPDGVSLRYRNETTRKEN